MAMDFGINSPTTICKNEMIKNAVKKEIKVINSREDMPKKINNDFNK